jgi:glycosyltransferase involved in cell wall biosynthesis
VKKINYIGPWNRTGYGYASLGYLACLDSLHKDGKIDLNYIPIGPVNPNEPELSQPENSYLLSYINRNIDWSADSLAFWHLSHLDSLFPQESNIKKAITTFEVSGLTDKEISNSSYVNKIAFASTHNRQIAYSYNNLYNSIYRNTIPHLPFNNVPTYAPNSEEIAQYFGIQIPTGTLTLCNIGKFEARKGHYELLTALDLISIPIVLVAYWFNPFLSTKFPFSELINRNYQPVVSNTNCRVYRKKDVTIIMCNPVQTRTELYSIATKCDGYICTSKAEGFNLPLYDLYMSKIPCISTTNTAMNDYLTSLSIPIISYDNAETAKDDIFFDGRFKWSKVDPYDILLAISKFLEKKQHVFHFSYTAEFNNVKDLLKEFLLID